MLVKNKFYLYNSKKEAAFKQPLRNVFETAETVLLLLGIGLGSDEFIAFSVDVDNLD